MDGLRNTRVVNNNLHIVITLVNLIGLFTTLAILLYSNNDQTHGEKVRIIYNSFSIWLTYPLNVSSMDGFHNSLFTIYSIQFHFFFRQTYHKCVKHNLYKHNLYLEEQNKRYTILICADQTLNGSLYRKYKFN